MNIIDLNNAIEGKKSSQDKKRMNKN